MFFPGMFAKSSQPVTSPAELVEAVGMTYDTYTGKRVSSQRAMRLTAVFWVCKGSCRIDGNAAM